MAKAFGRTIDPKIKKGSIYKTHDGDLVKVTLINIKDNRLDIKFFNEMGSIESIEFDTAHLYLKPLFTINEVSKMFNKAKDTLRKYERMGIIPKCPQYQLGGKQMRLYGIDDIMALAESLAQRKPVGRPAARKINISKVNQKDLMDGILKRYRRNDG